MYRRVGVARVKRVVHRRLERFVVRRHWSVLQSARDMKPAESVFMQHKRRVARNAIESPLVSSWSKLRRLIGRKIGDVDAGPFALGLVPPDQFLSIAPWLAGRFGARSIIYDAAIGRPGEAPTVPKIIRRVPRKRLVDFVRTENRSEERRVGKEGRWW